MQKRKKRTSDEICKDLKLERNRLYSKRSRLVNKQKAGKLTAKQEAAIEGQTRLLTLKIDKFGSKIFKCGKKYAAIKKERLNLIKQVSAIKRELQKDHNMDRKERNKKLTRLVELNERIRDLSVIMGKDIVLQESGKLWFLSDPTKMETVEMVVIWEIKQRVESLLASGSFDFLKVGEDTYPMETNALSAGFALDDYIADITASQREKTVRTPVIKMVVSLVTRTISIM